MGVVESVDSALSGLLEQWNIYSTGLATLMVIAVTLKLAASREPDIHPMLLARQSNPSTVRHEGESAVYRTHAAPHTMPLNSGLNVKDEGASRWSRGRDGDLRDVWRRAATGGEGGATGKMLTVLGSQRVEEHKIEDVTRQINLIGQHIAEQGGIRVAIYLPNSIEFLVTLFACSFYPNLTTVLVPFDIPSDDLISMLRRSAVDTVVTVPGAFPFDTVIKAYPALRQLIWVVDEGTRHLDWNEIPEGTGGSVNVATWQDIVSDAPAAAGTELPALDPTNVPQDVVAFWQTKPGQMEEMVRFSQAHLVAGISGQLAALPTKERLSQADLFLPADSLSHIHTLTLTLAALYSNASVALNSVAGTSPDLVLATQGVAPTVIVASPQSLAKTHQESAGKKDGSLLARASHSLATRTLSQDGVFAPSNFLSGFASGARPAIGKGPSKLRLVYVGERAGGKGSGAAQLDTSALSDLRIFTGARVIHALTAARVAGAVSQTALHDYRVDGDAKAHFGAPLSSVEVLLKDSGSAKTTDDGAAGEIFARGPAVVGGEASLGVVGKIRGDNTLAII